MDRTHVMLGAMDQMSRDDDILLKLPPIVADPAMREQREWLMRAFMKLDTELHERVVKPEVEAARAAAREAARAAARDSARRSLRRVLALRGLALTPEQETCIDAQADTEVLNRWHDQAVTAANAAEALALRVTGRPGSSRAAP